MIFWVPRFQFKTTLHFINSSKGEVSLQESSSTRKLQVMNNQIAVNAETFRILLVLQVCQ